MTQPVQFPARQQRGLAKLAKLSLDFTINNTLDPRITFSRTSNATRVNAQGLIEYAPHNLLTYSERFDNAAWLKTNATIAANATTAPDDASTADKLVENTAGGAHFTNQSAVLATGIAVTVSCYVKQFSSNRHFSLIFDNNALFGGNYPYASFNLSTGVVAVYGIGTASITSYSNGWYRCSLTVTPSASGSTNIQFRLQDNTTIATPLAGYTGDGTSGIYLWGAQLNQGALQPYYSTTVKNLLGYSQNFENAAWTKSNSSVLYNLLTYSSEFDNPIWSKINATITANATTAPDGTLTADKLEPATTAPTSIYQSVVIAASSYTGSVYVKKGSGASDANRFYLRDSTTSTTLLQVAIDYDTLVITYIIGSTGASVQNVGNGWLRVSLTVASGLTIGNTLRYGVCFVGNNETAGEFAYAWGAQLVQSTSPEEYTATTSASAPIQAIGPFGFAGGEKLVENTAAVAHTITQGSPTIGLPITYSFYAKAGERSKLNLVGGGYTSQGFANVFNLSTGVLDTNVGNKASITPVGNGWYRCAVSFTPSTTGGLSLSILDNTGNITYTGDGTSGIYIFGAQLSDSASLDPYSYNPVAAPTSTAYYGPRFDYDPVTLAPKGLLIEESRTNLLLQSAFASGWSFGNSASAGTITAPDGTNTGLILNDTSSVAAGYIFQGASMTSGITYAWSVYAKAQDRNDINLTSFTQAGGLTFSLVGAGSVGVASGIITGGSIQRLGNGWYRCTVIMTANATGTNNIGYSTNQSTYAGNAFAIWGAQLEAGAFPTSYIPTTSATVTRAADNASMVGSNFSSWYNQSEGTILTNYAVISPRTTDFTIFKVTDGTNTNRMQMGTGAGATVFNSFIIIGGVSQGNNIVTGSPVGIEKLGFAYSTNNTVSAANGLLGTVDTTASIPSVINQNMLGRDDGAGFLNGHIQSIKYYRTRLPNGTLQGLTA